MRGNRLFKFIDRCIGIPLLFIMCLLKGRRDDLTAIRPKRILVVKFSSLGDAILLVPALKALRKEYPDAEIAFLGTSFTVPFLRSFPEYVGEFITLDLGNLLRRPASILGVMKRLRSGEFELAIDFEQWLRLSALLVRFSGAPHRLGFRTTRQHRHFGFTHAVDRDKEQHESKNFLALAGLAARIHHEPSLEIKVDESGLVRAQGFLMRHGWAKGMPVMVVHPGCGSHGIPRAWAPKNYGELLSRFANDRSPFVVVTGREDERVAMDAVRRASQLPVVLYTISQLESYVALLSLSSLLISSNNGAMHIGAALGIPQVALHGPTNAVQWGPLNPHAVVIKSSCPSCPCLDLGFEYHRTDGYCMDQIEVEEVYAAVRGML